MIVTRYCNDKTVNFSFMIIFHFMLKCIKGYMYNLYIFEKSYGISFHVKLDMQIYV